MSRQWYFPKWRHLTMQGVMCLLLCATVGLAALLDRRLTNPLNFALADVTTDGPISLHFPAGWKIDQPDSDGAMVYQATEPDESGGRVIRIIRQHAGLIFPPMIYVREVLGNEPKILGQTTVAIDGHQATAVQWSMVENVDGQNVETQGLVYCLILPAQRQVVAILFQCPGTLNKADRMIMTRVVNSIKVVSGN